MIVRLNKEEVRQERRKLLGDDVYVVFLDALRQWQKDGITNLSPVELYLSAKAFAKLLMELPNVLEGIDDEMDDLEAEAEGESDAMIIMMLASGVLHAVSTHMEDFDARPVILAIYTRWNDHPLFFRFLEECAKKEQARWMEGRKTDLLTCELEEIERNDEGEDAVRHIFEYFVGIAEKTDKDSIKGLLLILNKYNIDHNNLYNKEMNALYEKLGIKSGPTIRADVYYAEGAKHYDNSKQLNIMDSAAEDGGNGRLIE